MRVATVLGRFVSRLASERYLGIEQDRAELARGLGDALGNARAELAQLLATVPRRCRPHIAELKGAHPGKRG